MPLKEKDKEILTEKITNTFVWTFKKGDNIIYNFEILWALYEAKKHYIGDKTLYNKPIIITLISIIECILDDFVRRIQGRGSDPLPNITTQIIDDFKYKIKGQRIEIKKLKKFSHYVYIIKKHNIFGSNIKFYETLDFLRNVRNKVHIQESKEDEYKIFTDHNLRLSEIALERIIKFMVLKYPRWGKEETIDNIPYPWKYL
jgi:hypothetical protein